MKIIFLDRDGVINNYPGDTRYITNWSEFYFLPGTKQAIRKLTEAGFKIFIISNQAGVTKGVYSLKTLDGITKNMLKDIGLSGGRIEDVFYCIHREGDNCSCRKPKTGLIDRAMEKFDYRHSPSVYFIGDSIIDVQTGKNSGCKTILVLSGKESLGNKPNWETQPDYIFKDLQEAVDFIIGEPSHRS